MTIRAVRKEMDMGQPMSPVAPSNNAPIPPQQPMQEPTIPDHTHPEYDQMLVKIQELENKINKGTMGGIEQDYEEEKPELKQMESYIKKVIREELKGVPEIEKGKNSHKIGPDNTSEIPQTEQPANGESPSGGEFDSNDKTNKEDGDDAISKTPKPKSVYDKIPTQKNKMELARKYIEKAKKLMMESNEPDPTLPNPEAEEKDPKKMDATISKDLDSADEDPEANIPNNKRPDMKEVFEDLKKEIKKENSRQSVVGMSSLSSARTAELNSEFATNKERVTNTVKEYLQKAGYSGAFQNTIKRF